MTYPITGIKAGLGPGEQVPLRREIDEWWFSKNENDLNQRSLFIYALHNFMNIDPDEQLSYFSIAGIHGEPIQPWDSTNKDWWFCAHGVPEFCFWHRPYVLLYEQRLYEEMRKLIPTTFAAVDHDAMYKAADTFRFPYWDWAMKKPDWDPTNPDSPKNLGPPVGPNVPYIITQENVSVKTITGTTNVPNPMWKFILPHNKLSPKKTTFGDYGITNYQSQDKGKPVTIPYPTCKATSRHPTTYTSSDPNYESAWVNGDKQNWNIITGEIRGSKAVDSNTLPEAVYRLFSTRPSYVQFATEGWVEGQPPKRYSSLEAVHGAIHVYTGGNGQMGAVPVAAFDPIFWMHHCNIDRLFAMWQGLYNDKFLDWIAKSPNPKEPVAPFSQDSKGTPYIPIACNDQRKDMGYTYPELQVWLPEYKTNGVFDTVKFQTALRAAIEVKYSTTGKSLLQLPKNARTAKVLMSNVAPRSLAVENFPQPLVQEAISLKAEKPLPITPTEQKWEENDYVVNVVYDRFALDGNPFLIRIFLGDVPPGPPYYFSDTPTQVGLVYNFSAPAHRRGASPEGCKNCKTQQEEGQLSSGQVILTDYLAENIRKHIELRGLELETLSRADVVEYLRKNLHWRVSNQNDVTVPKETMPSLKISVATAKATHYLETARFSEYGDYEVLWDVTEGRLGGANRGDLGL